MRGQDTMKNPLADLEGEAGEAEGLDGLAEEAENNLGEIEEVE